MIALLALLLLLAGCGGGTPTRFYALVPAPAPHAAAGCPGPPLGVDRVSLPDALDRQELVRLGDGGQLQLSGEQRWAGPLDSMIQHTLAQDLRQRLPSRLVLLPGDPSPPGGIDQIAVVVERFAPGPGASVTLQADWSRRSRQGQASAARPERIAVPAPGGDPALPMSQALGALADRIVASLCA